MSAAETPGVVATPVRLQAWAAAARPGERFVYATLCALPPRSAGAACARTLAARGLVYLVRTRVERNGPHNYFAERSSLPWPAAPVRRATLAVEEPELVAEVERAAVDQLLPLIQRTAQFARPCPTNKQMAERLRLPLELVEQGWTALRQLHLITVAPAPPPTNRRVTIVSTGWTTGLAA